MWKESASRSSRAPAKVGLYSWSAAPSRHRQGRRRTAKQRYELAASHCPMPPVLPTERIAHLGTADCCIHPPRQNEMIAITPPKIFSKEVAPKQATPFREPKNTRHSGKGPGDFLGFAAAPSPSPAWPRHAGPAALPRAQEHPAHGPVHRHGAGPVQGLLERLLRLA